MGQPRGVVLLTALILTAPVLPVLAQSAENVAVVINDLSPDSRRIGEHYARVRGLPLANILRIQTSLEDAIERSAYVRTIEQPVGKTITRAGLQDRLHFLVLTKGIPLRINGTIGLQGTLASVDSELTLLYRRLAGHGTDLEGAVDNPYFLGSRELGEARHFSHRDHDIYLVTRLDAFTADEALALIDRAQLAPTGGTIVLDQRAAGRGTEAGDEWMERAARRLSTIGGDSQVVLETTSKAARAVEGVLGRYAWGAADPEQRARTTGTTFLPGALAANLASFDARTFRVPPKTWQPTASADPKTWFEGSGDSLIGDLIRGGVTGVSGQVGEAYLRGAVRPEVLFPAYLSGYSLAEAFYLATPVLGWHTVIVGDPLTAPFASRRLTTTELEEDVDQSTGLPGAFSRRRTASMTAANPDVPAAALAAAVRALNLLDKDDKGGAALALAEAATSAPRHPSWLWYVGTLQEQAGDYVAAVATYQDVLKAQPTNVLALNNMAYVLAVHLGDPAQALPLARRAMSLAPRVGSIADTLGWTEHLLGNHGIASNLLSEAIRLDPTQPEIRLHAALVFAALKLWPQSDEQLKAALKLDPGLEVRPEVGRLRQRTGSKP